MSRSTAQLSLFDLGAVPAPVADEASLAMIGIRVAETGESVGAMTNQLGTASIVAVATAIWKEGVLGIAILASPGDAWWVSATTVVRSPTEVSAALSAATVVIGHDVKTQAHCWRKYGIQLPPRIFDTMVAAHLCCVPTHKLALRGLADHLVSQSSRDVERRDEGPDDEDVVAPAANELATTADQCMRRAVEEARMAAGLQPILAERMKREGVDRLFGGVEMPLLHVLYEMERDGTALDTVHLARVSAELSARMLELELGIFELSKHRFNVESPRQLARVLFDELKIPSHKLHRTRGGDISTSAWSLSDVRDSHPILPLVMEHRELAKLKGTYTDALPALLDPVDGRLHTTFNQVNTVTGRLSSTNPNLQNVPITSAVGRRVRQAFVARPGGLVISADYSQVELRILAHLANDAALIAAFDRGEDIHARTAANVYGVGLDAVTGEQRGHAKRINFGLAYGMGAQSLASSTGMSVREAHEFINRYFRGFPAVYQWIERTKREARQTGHVTTLMGRRRYFPDLLASSGVSADRRARAERLAINTPVQGSAADVIKIGMIKLQHRLRLEKLDTRMVLQVHDELVFDVPENERDRAAQVIREEMCHAVTMRAKLDISMQIGPNWDEAV